MAQRYGGKYSPQPQKSSSKQAGAGYTGAVRTPVGARSNLMFLPAIVLVFASLFQGAIGLALGAAGAGVLTLGAWLLRGGLEAEAAYHARKVARRPALPRKICAAALAGTGITLAALSHGGGLLAALLFGVVTTGLHIAAFGIDPLSHKGMEGIDTHQQDRVARVVDEADAHLRAMTDALKRVGDRTVNDHMAAFQETARRLIRTVENDPRDLTAARKYLGVYLMGARDATSKFADVFTQNQSDTVKSNFIDLLSDLDRNFAARTEKLLLDDHSDLTVEIEVLRDRLDREGVRVDGS